MNLQGPNRMWEESRAYDELHFGTKLDKVENFLSNESFPAERQNIIDAAEALVFVEEVFLESSARGRGYGLEAVKMVFTELNLPMRTVALLQAGAVGGSASDSETAGAKLTRHWRRLGFQAWSESDESWLLVELNNTDL